MTISSCVKNSHRFDRCMFIEPSKKITCSWAENELWFTAFSQRAKISNFRGVTNNPSLSHRQRLQTAIVCEYFMIILRSMKMRYDRKQDCCMGFFSKSNIQSNQLNYFSIKSWNQSQTYRSMAGKSQNQKNQSKPCYQIQKGWGKIKSTKGTMKKARTRQTDNMQWTDCKRRWTQGRLTSHRWDWSSSGGNRTKIGSAKWGSQRECWTGSTDYKL